MNAQTIDHIKCKCSKNSSCFHFLLVLLLVGLVFKAQALYVYHMIYYLYESYLYLFIIKL